MNELEQYWLHLFNNEPPFPFEKLSGQDRLNLSHTLGFASFKLNLATSKLWASIIDRL